MHRARVMQRARDLSPVTFPNSAPCPVHLPNPITHLVEGCVLHSQHVEGHHDAVDGHQDALLARVSLQQETGDVRENTADRGAGNDRVGAGKPCDCKVWYDASR